MYCSYVGVGFIRPVLFGNFIIGFDESNPYKLVITVFLSSKRYVLYAIFRDTNQTPENALNPPSMGTMIPVTNFEASEASQTHAPIKSSGSPNLSMGV